MQGQIDFIFGFSFISAKNISIRGISDNCKFALKLKKKNERKRPYLLC